MKVRRRRKAFLDFYVNTITLLIKSHKYPYKNSFLQEVLHLLSSFAFFLGKKKVLVKSLLHHRVF